MARLAVLLALAASATALVVEEKSLQKEAVDAKSQRAKLLKQLETAKTTEEAEAARKAYNAANAYAELVMKAEEKSKDNLQKPESTNSRVEKLLQRSKQVSSQQQEISQKQTSMLQKLKETAQPMPEKTWDMKQKGIIDDIAELFGSKSNLTLAPKVEGPSKLAIKNGKTYACQDKGQEVLTFYVNSGNHPERQKCMDAQLSEHCMPFERFQSVELAHCPEGDWNCMNHRVFNEHADCITKDVDWEAISTHGSTSAKGGKVDKWKVASAVMGNWCSHYRLMKMIADRSNGDPNFAKDYPAFLMLEDDVILDKNWAEEVLKDWVTNAPMEWDLVQLDPFGDEGRGSADEDKVGMFRNKQIYRPTWKGSYYGFHAVLVKTATVEKLLKKMDSFNVVPIDWIQKWINDDPQGLNSLAWDAGIAQNPENAAMKAPGKEVKIDLPKGCDQSITHTTIGLRQKLA